MPRLAPYQTGLWLAEYLYVRCQLCRTYRSIPQSKLRQYDSSSHIDRLTKVPSTFEPSINNTVFANICHQIDRRLNRGLLCADCYNSIVWLPTSFEVDIAAGTSLTIQAATYYDYPMRQAIRSFKHHEDMTKLPLLLHAIRQLPRPHGCYHNNSVIIAMPTTDQRLIKRGFDPVSILSAQLSKHWHIPLWHGVRRIDDTISQQGLTRAERLSNLDSAFALISKPPVKRLLLFDDVSTTGASLQALARVLISTEMTEAMSPKHHKGYRLSAYVLAHGSQ